METKFGLTIRLAHAPMLGKVKKRSMKSTGA